MTASYDPNALGSPINTVRFLLQDTGPTEWLFTNEEIGAVIPGGVLAQTSVHAATAVLADRLVARYSAMVDISEGSASASLSQLVTQYRQLATDMRTRKGVAAIGAASADGTYDAPAFTRIMGDKDFPT